MPFRLYGAPYIITRRIDRDGRRKLSCAMPLHLAVSHAGSWQGHGRHRRQRCHRCAAAETCAGPDMQLQNWSRTRITAFR